MTLKKQAIAQLKAIHPDASVPVVGGGTRAVTPGSETRMWEGKVVSTSLFNDVVGPNGEVLKKGNGSILVDIYRAEGTVKNADGTEVNGMLKLGASKIITTKCSTEELKRLEALGVTKSAVVFLNFSAILAHDSTVNANTGRTYDGYLAAIGEPGSADYRPAKPIHRVSGMNLSLTTVKGAAKAISMDDLFAAPAGEEAASGDLTPAEAVAPAAEAVTA